MPVNCLRVGYVPRIKEQEKRVEISNMGESSSNADVAVTIQGLVDPIIHDLPIVVSPHQAAGSEDARVDLDPKWMLSTDRKLLIRPRKIKATFSSCSIHRVPMDFRKLNENACVPQIISIGPFHYAKRSSDLQAMEEHKWRYARDFLTRNEEQSLERYLQTVKNLEQRARDCYSEEIDLDSNDFVEMMVLDACFIIELFLRIWDRAENFHPSDPVNNGLDHAGKPDSFLHPPTSIQSHEYCGLSSSRNGPRIL